MVEPRASQDAKNTAGAAGTADATSTAGAAGTADARGTGGRAERHRSLSLWWDTLPGAVDVRTGLPGDIDVDVAIVGAGYTGLWTARSLLLADPSLRVVLLEAEVAGFGASGRNGGWCSAYFAASDAKLTRTHGADAARRMRLAMEQTVDEVGRAAAEDGIDCHFAKGGSISPARDEAQVARAKAEVEDARARGAGEEDLCWLDPEEASRRIGASRILGATYTPHCAAIHPARLARGLAEAVERRGATIYEETPVVAIEAGRGGHRPRVRTDRGSVRADVVVRATEGWTSTLPGEHRTLVPIYSLMIATEPLDDTFWKEAGLANRETFSDHRHLIIYGQRTADGRIAFGGRGAPYHFGSAIRPSFDRKPDVHEDLHRTLVELFPALRDARVTHRWGGPIGVPRDWFSAVGFDRGSGVAWAGGYVGDGVSTTNLAGRTLADLVTGRQSDLVTLPWVGHRWPRWEPEPLRWLGVNAGLRGMSLADRSEARRGRPSRVAARMSRLLGG
jgi:glycine/D-amino acid oxidase-like deaminating enzyme